MIKYFAAFQVKKTLNLPVGKFTERHASRLDKICATKRALQITKAYKQRRKELKTLRSSSSAADEVREAPSYGSGIDLQNTRDTDSTEIPPAVASPSYLPLQSIPESHVFWDLETTGLGKSTKCNDFNNYSVHLL